MQNALQAWRKEIDRIDRKIIAQVAKRFRVARKIGRYKKAHKLPVRDLKREHTMLKDRMAVGKKAGIRAGVTTSIFSPILRESRRIQKRTARQ